MKDRRYQGWPRSVTEMLRPTFPGMMRHVRQNFFSVLLIVDPADPDTRHLVQMAEAFYVHSSPFRCARQLNMFCSVSLCTRIIRALLLRPYNIVHVHVFLVWGKKVCTDCISSL